MTYIPCVSASLLMVIVLSTSASAQETDGGVESDAGVAEPPLIEAEVALPRGPGLRSPVFEVGATVLTTNTAELRVGPTFRCTLYHGDFVASASLDWPIGGGPGRSLILAGAGMSRVIRPRTRLYGVALGGIDAINGPPILLLPVIALRTGADFLLALKLLRNLSASITMAYDVPYAWSGPGAPNRGLTFWLAVTAAFEVLP